MMIEKVFNNRNLGIKFNSYIDKKLRVWFKAKEVAQILGYQKTENAIKRHVSENHKRTFLLSCHPETGGQVQGRWIIFIDEAGFYELVFKSRLPAAKMFREWVFTKVLPSIRKYGYYKMIDSRIKQRVIIDGKNFTNIIFFTNYAASKDGEVINLKTSKIMNKKKRDNGYLQFTIYDKKLEKPFTYYQHRFVYEVFKGPIPKCLETDHINGIRTDNRIKNLQLLTPQKNSEKSNKPIISTCIETGKEIRFKSLKKASIELNIHANHISRICRKKHKTATSKSDGKKYTFRYLD